MTLDTTHSAAHHLENVALPNGWVVVEKLVRKPGATGGHFSIGYIAKKDNQTAFLKALNVLGMVKSGQSLVDVLADVSLAHKYERDLSLLCKNRSLSKVSVLLDHGEITLNGYLFDKVPYLIFEKADDDARGMLQFADSIDIAWKLKSLHNVAVGLHQLHKIDVGHHDLKPSNVFVFNNSVSKIGDLGRSVSKQIQAPHEDLDFSGDLDYAPPEVWYGYIIPDWNKRVFYIDLYLLGGLIAFYFSGLNMSTLISKNLDPQFHFSRWPYSFPEVSGYLMDAFDKALTELANNITQPELSKNVRELVACLCCPVPEQRGDKRTIITSRTPYDLTRIISRLDVLQKKAEYKVLK